MAKVYLERGPCNGRIVNLTPAEADTGELACRGHVYKNPYTGQHHGRYLVFVDSGPVSSGGGGGGKLHAPQALRGWHDLQKATGPHMRAALRSSERHTRAALRLLHGRRKVRG